MANRFIRFNGPPSNDPPGGLHDFPTTSPSAGGDVDAVEGGSDSMWPGKGTPFSVEAGGSFSSGADLETDANGRAVAASSGTVVARALEASSGAGEVVWAVWK